MGSLQCKVIDPQSRRAAASTTDRVASHVSPNVGGEDPGALTAYDIVQRLGGRARVAEHCDAAVNTVCGWYLSGLPASRVSTLHDLAQAMEQHDLTFEALHRAAARPPRPKAPAGFGPSRIRSIARD